ncbi:SPW repeat domain-containing protein [Piscinibacter koreensis]|uniref:NAD-dependent epimerase/dehydratase family protein n=1 Tax=Piscinibacter koreensis TaxID=2742824 RepID=A0A7Y6TYQ4_9BURK|nr:vitamin K epoxide reductase family protein [Schlegelella koreensis]NUZ08449.1 NAD-dependent epimerase/dehydratase family protein [Schlegelella koreensis]
MTPKGDIVLVTGSNGRIGTAVMERLRGRFDNIVGFDRKAATPPPPDCVAIPVDVASDESVRDGLRILREHHGSKVATVVHLAAYYDFGGEASPKYDQITVEGTRRLLRGLREGFEVQQFIFASTMLVHSPGEPGIFINEDSPIGPTWAYPESKVRTEAVIRAEHGPIPTVVLRLAGVYDDNCHSPPLANQMQRIYERQLASHLYSGPTSHGQSFVHMDDVVDAIERAVEKRASLPQETVLLIGEPETLSYDELQHTMQRLIHGESWETVDVPGPIAKVGAWVEDVLPGKEAFIKPWMIDRANDHYALEITRAKTVLDWTPRRSLRATLPEMVSALKADPLGWYHEQGLEPPSSLTDGASPVDKRGAPSESKAATTAAPAGHDHAAKQMAAAAQQYTCPMHPDIVRSAPGSCPKCGMTLVPREPAPATGPAARATGPAAPHGDMMVEAHRAMLWPHYLSLMLGIWLLTSPFALGYLSAFVPDANLVRVSAERGLPSFDWRNLAMTWSDVASGALIVVFSYLAANADRRYPWAQWANAVVGGWLLFAPLVFWSPLPEAYANDTLIGVLVIALAVLIPMMPGMSMAGMMGKPDIPPGWSYTPASWVQRAPVAVLAFVGLLLARYMTAYQLGYTDSAWDPFFAGSGGRNGTVTIITSDVSKAWPIADSGLGAVVYTLELVMTFMGGKDRWRTMPWMVLALAVLILPLGIVSIYFIIIQPIVIGTWCTPCLIAALAMVLMIPYSLDEFVAMGQFLLWAHRNGKPFWRTFWTGDAMEGGSDDTSKGLLGSRREIWAEAARGVTFPWTLWLSVAIGVWLTFTRVTFASSGAMANSDHLIGALVVTFSIMAFAEVGRALRFVNVALGAWLIVAPWLLGGTGSPLAAWNGAISGVLLIALAIPLGAIRNSYADWDPYVVWRPGRRRSKSGHPPADPVRPGREHAS